MLSTHTKSLGIFVLAGLVAACSPKLNLPPNQYLLHSQTIKGNKSISIDELSPLFQQKVNRKFLGISSNPYLWAYKFGERRFDKQAVENEIEQSRQRWDEKINLEEKPSRRKKLENKKQRKLEKLQNRLEKGNFIMQRFGEAPVIYDSTLAQQTANQIQLYYRNKGFLHDSVTFQVKIKDTLQKIQVTYQVTETERYLIKNLHFIVETPHIDSLLQAEKENSFIKENSFYDKDLLNKERERIDKLLRNKGYFAFNREFITFLVNDTIASAEENKKYVGIEITIQNPSETQPHQRYQLNEIYFITDANFRGKAKRDTILFRNIHYLAYKNNYSLKVLSSKVLLKPKDFYALDKVQNTQRRLGGLDIFKFANIIFDTVGTQLNARILASPLERFQSNEEVGGTVSQGLPGPYVGLTFKFRNPFRDLGIFEFNVRAAVEGQTGFIENRIYASTEISVNSSLIFPKILFPTPIRFKFDGYNPNTRLVGGYNFTDRLDFKRRSLRASMIYSWNTSPKRRFTVSLVDVNYVTSINTDGFEKYLTALQRNGNQLIQSFLPGFVSNIGITYTYNDLVPNLNETARYWRIYAENGGAFINLLPPILSETDKLLNSGLQLYRYYRVGIDVRYYRPVGKKSYLVYRVNAGMAGAYGNTPSLPYEKFFFSGGSNSIRAWAPRRLGPGSALPIPDSVGNTESNRYRFEEQGNILLEFNVEYRFPVVKYINMALFSDAGNIWTFKDLPNRIGSSFNFNRFYKEIAWGAGLGIRLDLSFLIIRADVATKIYEPTRPEGSRWVARNLTLSKLSPFKRDNQLTLLNVGIGYPF
jgi:outer membrane protein insertion porin family